MLRQFTPMAPNAYILFVGGSCDQVDVVDEGVAEEPLYQVIDQQLADIITNSWTYIGEGDVSAARLAIDTFQHLQAAAEGITVLFASGDGGDSTAEGIPVASGQLAGHESLCNGSGRHRTCCS